MYGFPLNNKILNDKLIIYVTSVAIERPMSAMVCMILLLHTPSACQCGEILFVHQMREGFLI